MKSDPKHDDERGLDRRGFLAAAAGVAGLMAMAPDAFARNFGSNAEPVRYSDPDIIAHNPRFKAKLGNTPIRRRYTGTLWAEGPAWNGVGRYLIWSDIPSNEQLCLIKEDGHVSRRFRSPSGNSNGNTFDFSGRQISCEHGNRRVVRYEYDGSQTVLADAFENEGFNAPNDAVVHPNDGSIWFTDPGYGGLMNYEGERLDTGSPQPIRKEAVYRIDGQTGAITKVTDAPFKPNGLCFSHDYKLLYIADTGVSHYPDAKSQIWVADVDGATLKNERTFTSMTFDGKTGFADGIRCEEDGNIWSSAGWVGDGYDGVFVFAPNGDRIG
ncbi:SMP-30/gluconolactonase/LRE family protein [Paracoccaceae bacterium]|nr:SMP-30/gluconolactonase/LRE family protein [Paracoccaceae bacterium]